MAGEPSDPTPPPPPSPPAPSPPGPGASRDEWRAWRRQQHEYARSQWTGGDWYPWGLGWGWGGTWGWFWGAALVLVGAYYLLSNLGFLTWVKGDVLWPSLAILLGIVILLRRGRHWWP